MNSAVVSIHPIEFLRTSCPRAEKTSDSLEIGEGATSRRMALIGDLMAARQWESQIPPTSLRKAEGYFLATPYPRR